MIQEESDELLYTVWPLVMVRNQLPAQVVKLYTYVHKLQKLNKFEFDCDYCKESCNIEEKFVDQRVN